MVFLLNGQILNQGYTVDIEEQAHQHLKEKVVFIMSFQNVYFAVENNNIFSTVATPPFFAMETLQYSYEFFSSYASHCFGQNSARHHHIHISTHKTLFLFTTHQLDNAPNGDDQTTEGQFRTTDFHFACFLLDFLQMGLEQYIALIFFVFSCWENWNLRSIRQVR